MTGQLFERAQGSELPSDGTPDILRPDLSLVPVFSDSDQAPAVAQAMPETALVSEQLPSRFSDNPDTEQRFRKVKETFDGAFDQWKGTSEEFFHRIAGVGGEPSARLTEMFDDLTAFSYSTELQAKPTPRARGESEVVYNARVRARTESQFIFNSFVRPFGKASPLSPDEIQELLAEPYPDDIRYQTKGYVAGRLLTIMEYLAGQVG